MKDPNWRSRQRIHLGADTAIFNTWLEDASYTTQIDLVGVLHFLYVSSIEAKNLAKGMVCMGYQQ